jgi:general secretion pathway protein D
MQMQRHQTQHRSALTLLAACFCCATACAQVVLAQAQPPTPTPENPAPPQHAIELPSSLELARLLDVCAQQLRLDIEYDPGVVQGSVTMRAADPLTPQQLWELANRQLVQRGLTSVRQPGSDALSIVRIDAAASLARVEPIDEPASLRAGFETILLRAPGRTSRELAELARTVTSKQGGQVTEAGGENGSVVLVSDVTARLDQVRMLVAALDQPSPLASILEVTPTHLSAETLVAIVKSVHAKQEAAQGSKVKGDIIVAPSGKSLLVLGDASSRPYWLDLIARLDRQEAISTRTYRTASFRPQQVAALLEQSFGSKQQEDGTRIVIDDLTSSLSITASASQHEVIAAMIARLEENQPAPLPVRSFKIKNRSVEDVVATLTNLLDAGVFDAASTGSRTGVNDAARQRSERPLTTGGSIGNGTATLLPAASSSPVTTRSSGNGESGGLRLTADAATNTLIAVGDAGTLAQLEAVLPTIDVRQPQVMLEVLLVSLTDAEGRNLGVELERLGKINNTAFRVASLFGLSTASAAGRVVGDATGFTGAALNPGEFSIVVRALETLNKGRTQSSPRLLVTNNEQATFSSVIQQPFTAAVSSSGGTAQGFGGTEDAGTTISVRPQIAQGDHLVLTYSIKLSSFVGDSTAPGLPPPKQQNAVDSVATIPDGHTVVVGGLELLTDSDGTRQIPGLGRLPLLGNLFKSRNENTSASRFYVFIRAHILRNSGFEDLRYLSDEQSGAAKVDDGFPDVHPQVIR